MVAESEQAKWSAIAVVPDMPWWRTLGLRFLLIAAAATASSFLLLGVPSAVIPNPLFVRMTPTEPVNLAVWLLSAPLLGVITATYLDRLGAAVPASTGSRRTTLASVGAYLAIGCPICNKVVVALLGVSGALQLFAPLQPVIGAGSVVLLGLTAVWRLRQRGQALVCRASVG